MIALYFALTVVQRDQAALEELISIIASTHDDLVAVKQIFKPVLENFTAEDREWFDQLRQDASWNS